jgi:hypothetical protein
MSAGVGRVAPVHTDLASVKGVGERSFMNREMGQLRHVTCDRMYSSKGATDFFGKYIALKYYRTSCYIWNEIAFYLCFYVSL